MNKRLSWGKYKFHCYFSNKYFTIQIIDCVGNIITCISTCNKKFSYLKVKNNMISSYHLGIIMGKFLINKGIKNLFLNSNIKYYGKVRSCHKAIKEIGLNF